MRLQFLTVAFVFLGIIATASAARVEYTIDPARSYVTVLGAIRTDSFQPRLLGSSKINYTGAFFGDLNGDQLIIDGAGASDTARSFGDPSALPAYDLIAETFEGDALLSILSISFSGSSSFNEPAISISEGVFPGHQIRFFIGGGTIRFQPPGSAGPIDFDMHGRGSPNTTQRQGSIVTENNLQTLTVPLDMAALFSLEDENDTILTFSGQFVATRAIPEPNTALFFAIGMCAAVSRWRRMD